MNSNWTNYNFYIKYYSSVLENGPSELDQILILFCLILWDVAKWPSLTIKGISWAIYHLEKGENHFTSVQFVQEPQVEIVIWSPCRPSQWPLREGYFGQDLIVCPPLENRGIIQLSTLSRVERLDPLFHLRPPTNPTPLTLKLPLFLRL